jgi:hypothetical protein
MDKFLAFWQTSELRGSTLQRSTDNTLGLGSVFESKQKDLFLFFAYFQFFSLL